MAFKHAITVDVCMTYYNMPMLVSMTLIVMEVHSVWAEGGNISVELSQQLNKW